MKFFDHFLNKRMPEFWKCWACKFQRNLDKEVYVKESTKPADITEAFASHFSSVYTNSDGATTAKFEGLHRMSSDVMTYLGLLMLKLSANVLEN